MELFFVTVIGICIGSFLNVCIYRIAREESIAFPPSHCTSCGYELKAKDLVPVISYILLRGKCRSCKEKISIKYPIIEIFNAIVYVLIYLSYGLSLNFIKLAILASVLIVIGVIDFETQFVYRTTVIFSIIAGIIFAAIEWFTTGKLPVDKIVGAGIGFVVIGLIVVLTRGMGEGDIDIALICGLFLGVKGIIVTLFLAFILGGIVATIILIFKLKGRRDEMAFGPYLALGAIIAMIWGSQLLTFYGEMFV